MTDYPRDLSSKSSDRSEAYLSFLERSKEGGLLFDGAIGTQLYERGIFLNQCFEQVSLSQPRLIKQVHRDYFEAGAEVLTTNTFGANSIKLAQYGLESRWREINIESVRIARDVARDSAFVAGSVGPSGVTLDELSRAKGRDALNALTEQVKVLIEEGVDLICLETFSVLQELEIMIERTKALGVPVVGLYTFQANGLGSEGQSPQAVGQRLIEAGADVIGSNCGGGPDLLYQVTTPMVGLGVPVLAQANAGRPELIEGRSIYVANHEYFSVYTRRLLKAGVKVVGGCCGTTPEHIKKMANATRMINPQSSSRSKKRNRMDWTPPIIASVELKEPQENAQEQRDKALRSKSDLGRAIADGEFVTSVEINPPLGFDLSSKIASAAKLHRAGVSTINIADGPRASIRMSNVAMAHKVNEAIGIDPIVHLCCRDRSFLGLQSHILGAHVMGIRNLVVITGDPPKMGPFPHSTGVYDLDSIELLRVINAYNHGVDPTGKEMPSPTSFLLATGVEPAAKDFEHELRRLEMKRDAGAELVMTQPVYDPRQVERFLIDAKGLGLPILMGLCPLASYKNALFLHQNVPGMKIPESILERMKEADANGRAEEEGVMIARESLEAARGLIQGAYLMPPFGRTYLAEQVLEGWITARSGQDL